MPGTPDERLRRRYNMDKAHAYYEFNRKKNFKAALDLLKGIEVSPITVLRLYPWLLPKKHENRGEPMMSIQRLSEQDKAAATEALILYLTEVIFSWCNNYLTLTCILNCECINQRSWILSSPYQSHMLCFVVIAKL